MSMPFAVHLIPWRKVAKLANLLLVGGLLVPLHAHSASTYDTCMKRNFKNDNLEGAVRCADPELQRFKTRLETANEKVRAVFIKEYGADHPMVSGFQENHVAWEKYRETLCTLRIGHGGLWSALDYYECTLTMYKQRLETLKAWGG